MILQNRNDQFLASLKWEPVLAWLVVLGYCVFSGNKYATNILITYAYGGWSPMDWVNHLLHAENFKADFPSGIGVYAVSSFMQLYLLLARLGVDLEWLAPRAIVFETLFLGISAAIAFRALVPKAPHIVMAIFALLVVEGSARNMELARFAPSFFQGLYYNVADGFQLLGLAMLLQRRVIASAALLGVGCTVHPVMVGMACLFAIPYILLIRRSVRVRTLMIAGTVFLGTAGAWLFLRFFQQAPEISSGGIPPDIWIAFARAFNYHWFSVDIGVFTDVHERYLVPFICLVSLAVLYLPRVVDGRAERHGIGWGMALLGMLSCAGSLIPELSNQPFLIKLALHRASSTLILVSLLVVVAGLTKDIFEGDMWETALAGALLLSPLANSVPFALLPTVCLIGLRVWRTRQEGGPLFYAPLASMGVLLGCVSLYQLAGIAKWAAYRGDGLFWEASNALTRLSDLIRGGKGRLFWEVSLVFAAVWCARQIPGAAIRFNPALRTVLLATGLLLSVHGALRNATPSQEWKNVASDYLAVQRWAIGNTPSTALFMVDPTIYYGWRDFSQRSSFGNLREWLHTSWLYDSKRTNYEEGLKRFSELGINIEPYLKVRPAIDGFERLNLQVKKEFYRKEDEWFRRLSREYGIGYLVLEKVLVAHGYGFEKVFQNDRFVVYRLSE